MLQTLTEPQAWSTYRLRQEVPLGKGEILTAVSQLPRARLPLRRRSPMPIENCIRPTTR